MTNPKRPRDPNQLAKLVADIATGQRADEHPDAGKDVNAVARGRKGGLAGGKARMEKLTAEEKSKLGEGAAAARWGKGTPPDGGAPKGQWNKRS